MRSDIADLLIEHPEPETCDRTALMLGLRALGLPAEAAAAVGAVEGQLARFASLVRCRMQANKFDERWPDPDDDHELAAAYLMGFALALDALELHCSQAGFDDTAINELKTDIAWWAEAYHRRQGHWGLREIGWCKRHFQAKLLPVGRLQFEPVSWRRQALVLEHQDGGYVVLAGEGEGIGEDDHLAGEEQIRRRSVCEEKADAWFAHRCHADGSVAEEPELFPKSAWHCLLRPGDEVLSLHIPARGPMRPEDISASFAAAMPQVARIWPERARQPLVCDSWLLDRQLQGYLKPTANITAFQNRFLNCPDGPERNDNLRFAFDLDRSPDDWRQLRPQGSLQNAIINHLMTGKVWRGGRGVRPWPWSDEPVQLS